MAPGERLQYSGFQPRRHKLAPHTAIILFVADGIRLLAGAIFSIASRENAYSLIGSISFLDWSPYARRPNPLGADCGGLRHRRGDDLGGDAMDSMAARVSAATR
jgi:hypothetical protein